MRKEELIHVRLEGRHGAKVKLLRQLTGLNRSEIVRQLIDRAEVITQPGAGATIALSGKAPPRVQQDTATA